MINFKKRDLKKGSKFHVFQPRVAEPAVDRVRLADTLCKLQYNRNLALADRFSKHFRITSDRAHLGKKRVIRSRVKDVRWLGHKWLLSWRHCGGCLSSDIIA